MLFLSICVTNQQTKVLDIYGLLEEHLSETKLALYISIMFKSD